MFDPIKGPTNQYQGPAVGLGTENGDSWHAAVVKINAGFKNIVKAIEGGAGMTADVPDDAALGERLSKIEDELAALQIKIDALTTPAVPAANTQPAEPAAQQVQTLPSPAPNAPDPHNPVAAIPVTTSTTYIGAGNPAAQ